MNVVVVVTARAACSCLPAVGFWKLAALRPRWNACEPCWSSRLMLLATRASTMCFTPGRTLWDRICKTTLTGTLNKRYRTFKTKLAFWFCCTYICWKWMCFRFNFWIRSSLTDLLSFWGQRIRIAGIYIHYYQSKVILKILVYLIFVSHNHVQNLNTNWGLLSRKLKYIFTFYFAMKTLFFNRLSSIIFKMCKL